MSGMITRRAAESATEMVQLVLPSNANALNAAFGGSVMGWIDICAAICAQRHCRQVVVTASMDDLHFHAPIRVGWAVTLKARVIATFNTSMEIGVSVHSEDPFSGEKQLTTSALLTFVALDKEGRRLSVPQLEFITQAERSAAEDARVRRQERLARKSQGQSWLSL